MTSPIQNLVEEIEKDGWQNVDVSYSHDANSSTISLSADIIIDPENKEDE